MREILSSLARASFFGLDDRELVAQLGLIQQAVWQAEELLVRAVGEVDARGAGLAETGAKSSQQLLTGAALRMTPDKASKTLRLARRLRRSSETGPHGGVVTRPGLGRIKAAFSEGRFGFDHAWRCAETMAGLPEETSHHTRRRAEQDLVKNASRLDPANTARIGRRLLHVLDPELAERRLREQLEREEKRANRDRTLWFRDAGHGKVQFGGWLDTAAANTLKTALDPLSWARYKADNQNESEQQSKAGTQNQAENVDARLDRRSRPQRMADALVDLAEHALRTAAVPAHGGEPTQVVVTIRLSDLVEGINAAYLPTGEAISATQARIMACDARIIPVVLDSAGVPLDVGQGRRTFTGKLRKALELRDQGCAFPHCNAPAAWCDGHHILPWHQGGSTALDNSVLLCRHHHRLVHTEGWQIRLADDRRPDFIPPPWIDPDQRPMRNPRTGSPVTSTATGARAETDAGAGIDADAETTIDTTGATDGPRRLPQAA